MRIAIVDDEEPARLVLREYLIDEPGVEIVAECANGFEAVKAVTEHKPDVMITDIQMPKLDGFEVLDLVGRETNVIFATAYDEFALKAFEVHAIDYLLKPFSRERLREAVARARRRLDRAAAGPVPDARPDAAVVATAARPAGTWITRIVIRDGAEVHVVPIDRVDYVEAQDDYIAVHAGDRTLLKDQALGSLEAQLDPRRFVRVHRSFLLNLDRLAKLEPATKDTKVAVLRDGRRLPVSRSGQERLSQLL
ncbi:MAG: LytTR family DNA-binding domain-containing protein [Acidobacteriota bacterium]|nr:LytTR family DNA-binding domain-containing protein [Acidobacteriota bacterium]